MCKQGSWSSLIIFVYSISLCYRCLNTSDHLELSEKLDISLNGRQYRTIKLFCGNLFPAPILVNRETQFTFVSKRDSSFQGFKAKYEFITKSEIQRGE